MCLGVDIAGQLYPASTALSEEPGVPSFLPHRKLLHSDGGVSRFEARAGPGTGHGAGGGTFIAAALDPRGTRTTAPGCLGTGHGPVAAA